MSFVFEWDPRKADANATKHGVTFEEARAVFVDPLAQIFDDPDHSLDERREIIIGQGPRGRILVVCFTERGGRVRIVSARPVTRRERKAYEENV